MSLLPWALITFVLVVAAVVVMCRKRIIKRLSLRVTTARSQKNSYRFNHPGRRMIEL